MASSSSSRRRRDLDDDLEEGEYVPGGYGSTDTDDDDRRFRIQTRGGEEEGQSEDPRGAAWRAAAVAAALPSPTPSCESDGTISDYDGNRSPSSAVATTPLRVYACRVCGKEFGSPKAVDGHMRVHDPRGRHGHKQGKEERYVAAVDVGWAATGKRGWTGGKAEAAASSNAQSSRSVDMVDAEPKRPLEPIPMAFAVTNLSSMSSASARTNNILDSGERSSAQPIRSESTSTNPSTEAVVHQSVAPPPPEQRVQVVRQPVPPPPASQQGQAVHQLAAPPPPAAQQGQPPAHQPAAARREYTCKECGKSFPTHQGLGGHAAGHMNRKKEAEAAAAAAGILQADGSVIPAACCRGAKEETTVHTCKRCNKVFATGVALGGHMRMHYTGPPIVHRKSKKHCLAPPTVVVVAPPPPPAPIAEGLADHHLTLALSIKAEYPSPAPAVAGRVRLFGIDIGPHVQAQPKQQGSGMAMGSPSEQQGSGTTSVELPLEQQGSGTTVELPLEQQGSGMTVGSPSGEQRGPGTTVVSTSEQQGSDKAVGSSSAGGQQ